MQPQWRLTVPRVRQSLPLSLFAAAFATLGLLLRALSHVKAVPATFSVLIGACASGASLAGSLRALPRLQGSVATTACLVAGGSALFAVLFYLLLQPLAFDSSILFAVGDFSLRDSVGVVSAFLVAVGTIGAMDAVAALGGRGAAAAATAPCCLSGALLGHLVFSEPTVNRPPLALLGLALAYSGLALAGCHCVAPVAGGADAKRRPSESSSDTSAPSTPPEPENAMRRAEEHFGDCENRIWQTAVLKAFTPPTPTDAERAPFAEAPAAGRLSYGAAELPLLRPSGARKDRRKERLGVASAVLAGCALCFASAARGLYEGPVLGPFGAGSLLVCLLSGAAACGGALVRRACGRREAAGGDARGGVRDAVTAVRLGMLWDCNLVGWQMLQEALGVQMASAIVLCATYLAWHPHGCSVPGIFCAAGVLAMAIHL